MDHRADIEGLRAVAVLPVMLSHVDRHGVLAGGFIGVDVFFVISGFLITRMLSEQMDAGTFSLTGFYRRRVCRLFPAFYAMLLACVVAGAILLAPVDYIEFGKTAFAATLFASNLELPRLGGYFDSPAVYKPLLHTWSLAVEEQFYLLYPLLLLCLRRRFAAFVPAVIAGLAALSLLASGAGLADDPAWSYYATPSRAFELLIGALIAMPGLRRMHMPLARELAAGAGLAAIITCMFCLDQTTPFPGPWALVPCVGTALLLHTGAGHLTAAGRLLSSPPLRYIGRRSYALYLWHWPILAFTRHYYLGEPAPWVAVLTLPAAMVMAIISWRFIERPALAGAIRRPLRLGAFATVTAALLSAGLAFSDGLPQRFGPGARALFAATQDFNHRRPLCHSSERQEIPYEQLCALGLPGATPDIAVWGDSYAAELAVAIGETRLSGTALQISATACPPVPGYSPRGQPGCGIHNQGILDHLKADPRIRTVVLTANFASYQGTRWHDFAERFSRSAADLRAAGKRVVLVYPIPVYDYDPPSALGLLAERNLDFRQFGVAKRRHDTANAPALGLLDDVAARLGAGRIKPHEVLCDQRLCLAYSESAGPLYFNRSHLSVAGARFVVEQYQEILRDSGTP